MARSPLTREEHAFREPPKDDGKPGLAYHLHQKRLDFRLTEFRQIAQNLSDDSFRWQKYEKDRPEDYTPTDDERHQYGLNGNLQIERRRALGFISEEGTERYRGPIYLDMHTRSRVSDRGQIWFYEKDEYNDRPGLYVSIYLSEQRMMWLWEQMRLRPHAEVHVCLEVMLWQHEVDNMLAEPDQYQDYYIEKAKRQEIVGATLFVGDKDTPPWKDPDEWDEPEDDEKASESLTSGRNGPPATQASDAVEKLLRRLVRGVGWVIGLLVFLILVVMMTGGDGY